jgi:hypothetical protein
MQNAKEQGLTGQRHLYKVEIEDNKFCQSKKIFPIYEILKGTGAEGN